MEFGHSKQKQSLYSYVIMGLFTNKSSFNNLSKVILIDKQTISWSGTPKEMFVSKNTKIQEFIKPINSEIFFK